MNRALEFAPRSSADWARLCAAALPSAARQILREARAQGGYQVDPADAWIAHVEQKSESQTRSKARRQNIKGWGTGARAGGGEADEADQIDHTDHTTLPGLGEWAQHQDPAAARAALEIRAAVEICDVAAALEAAGLADLVQDPAAVKRLRGEMQSWAVLADLDEVDAGDIALRDRVTRRMAQHALKARREALVEGQGVLL